MNPELRAFAGVLRSAFIGGALWVVIWLLIWRSR